MKKVLLLLFLFGFFPQNGSELRGRVVDLAGRTPLSGVKLVIEGSQYSTVTDEAGQFIFRQLPAGEFDLLLTAPGYGVSRQHVLIKDSEVELPEIALERNPSPVIGETTITDSPFAAVEANAASEASLNQRELRNATGILLGDIVRTAQSLPGVTGNDDLSSRFTLRGAGMRRIGFLFDGVLTGAPAHSIQEEQGGGSVSILNPETIQAVSLLAGAFPVKYGDATAGVLSFETREGNRDRAAVNLTASLINSSAAAEGPLPSHRGSWLLAARRSYLNYILSRLNRPGVRFDFTDLQGKMMVDLNARHQVGATAIFGFSAADQERFRARLSLNDLLRSESNNRLLIGYWNYLRANFSAQTRAFHLHGDYTNLNPAGLAFDVARLDQSGVRSDLTFLPNAAHQIEGGVYFRLIQGQGFRGIQSDANAGRLIPLVDYRRSAWQQSVYLQDTWKFSPTGLALTAGLRVERFGLNREMIAMPRLAVKLPLSKNSSLRLGLSRHAQFPDFNQLFGLSGNAQLAAERATHYNLGFDRYFGDNTRLTVELYQRRESGLIFSPDEDAYRAGLPVATVHPAHNALNGSARGIEISLHQRGSSRLIGWLSYSY